MRMNKNGTVEVMGCKARVSQYGTWIVSRSGIIVGEVDSLAEVEALILRRNEEIAAKVARLEAEAAARHAAREAERAEAARATKEGEALAQ
jgi:hypothetical protein